MAGWPNERELFSIAERVAAQLRARRQRLVLAESCTGGLAAAALATVPGVSDWFCGSAVTYRQETKREWLGVAMTTLEQQTAVDPATTREMAIGALRRTPEADWSAAITGHLGPNAPAELDGKIFISFARRADDQIAVVFERTKDLPPNSRTERQALAAQELLVACRDAL